MKATKINFDRTEKFMVEGEYSFINSEGVQLWVSSDVEYSVKGYEKLYTHNCCVEEDCEDETEGSIYSIQFTNVVFADENGDDSDYVFTKEEEKAYFEYLKSVVEEKEGFEYDNR